MADERLMDANAMGLSRARSARRGRVWIPVLVSLAAIAGLGLVAYRATHLRTQPATPAEAPPAPIPDAKQRERAARALLAEAARVAAPGQWRRAERALSRLEAEFADTDAYAVNRSTVAALRATIEAELTTEPAPDQPRAALAAYRKGVRALRPLWDRRHYAGALGAAKAMAEGELAASPEAAKWLVDDAQALAELWQAVEAGAGALKPGQPLRIGGVEGQFVKLDHGVLVLRQGRVALARPLVHLDAEQLIAFAGTPPAADPGRRHLALALLWLHGFDPNVSRARSELHLAAKAGVDVARHQALVAGMPRTPVERVRVKRSTTPVLTFTGQPLTVEAEAAHLLYEPMQVERDPSASGNQFVWEPRKPDQGQFGDRNGRAVFYIRARETCTVHLWARVRSPDDAHNSFHVAIAPGRATRGRLREWHLPYHSEWTWAPYDAARSTARRNRRPVPMRLRAGLNSLIIAVRERATALDQIRISPP